MGDVTVTVYGGTAGRRGEPHGEIGGNRILLEYDGGRWFFDFGLRFAVNGRYYEEFLKPRGTTLGLRDYLKMGLLPPIEGLYRDDLTCHEPDVWDRYREHPSYRRLDDVDGVLVSHGHLDHNGCIGFLRREIPVYTGLTTAVTAKSMQDLRSAGPENEFCYIAPREERDGLLKMARSDRLGRRHVVCEDTAINDAITSFWAQPNTAKIALDSIPLESAMPANLRFWRVDHSIPGSGAFGVETPIGWVIYSGDVRRHGYSKGRVDEFIAAAAALKPAALVVEGTRVRSTTSVDESDVEAAAGDLIAKADGVVIADFGPRNIERLRTFHDVAVAGGRQLVITAQDAFLLDRLHDVDENIPDPSWGSVRILRKPMGTEGRWMKDLFDTFAADVIDADDVRRDPSAFVLALSYWDISALVDIEPSGGTYIYSSAEAFTEEMAIDHARLANWLDHFGFERHGGLPGAEDDSLPLHASGHADGPALESLIDEIAPEWIVPVHTTSLDWFEERWPDKVLEAPYGVPIRIG